MLKKIEKLRKKPKHIKDRYAFWIALSCTAVIALVWLISVPSRFDTTPTLSEESSEQVSNFARMWGVMRSNLTASISDIRSHMEDNGEQEETATSTEKNDDTSSFISSSSPKTTEGATILIATTTRKAESSNDE